MDKQFEQLVENGIRILKKEVEDYKNWQSSRSQLGDLLNAVTAAKGFLVEFDKEKAKQQKEISNNDARLLQQEQQLKKNARQLESTKPDSERMRDIESREQAVTAREVSVLGREEKVLVEEEKIKVALKNAASTLAGLGSLDS